MGCRTSKKYFVVSLQDNIPNCIWHYQDIGGKCELYPCDHFGQQLIMP